MTIYRLLVTRVEPNPNYEKEIAEANERRKYSDYGGNSTPWPERERTVKTLEVELTDTEYVGVKAAVLKTFA